MTRVATSSTTGIPVDFGNILDVVRIEGADWRSKHTDPDRLAFKRAAEKEIDRSGSERRVEDYTTERTTDFSTAQGVLDGDAAARDQLAKLTLVKGGLEDPTMGPSFSP